MSKTEGQLLNIFSFLAEIAASLSRLAMTINTVPVITIPIIGRSNL